jgi:hypothetical protein
MYLRTAVSLLSVATLAAGCAQAFEATSSEFDEWYCSEFGCGDDGDNGRADLPGWAVPSPYHDRFEQHHSMEGTMIDAFTRFYVDAAPADVVSLLRGDWNRWWRSGLSQDRTEVDGTIEFDFWPIAVAWQKIAPTEVHVQMGPTEFVVDGTAYGIPVYLTGDFRGPAYFVIFAADAPEDSPFAGQTVTYVASLWERVEVKGFAQRVANFVVGDLPAQLHLAAEAGALPVPRGTGFPGLIECLERGECVE